MRVLRRSVLLFLTAGFLVSQAAAETVSKPLLTLDEFFNSVSIDDVRLSPEGSAVVIATTRPDWEHNRFHHDLWLYRDANRTLLPLTRSGYDTSPEWSPDGRWIAFLSDRPDAAPSSDSGGDPATATQVYVIAADGGEAFPVTRGDEPVHAFAWGSDSHVVYFATRDPWSKEQKEKYRQEWNDVIRFREAERGDTLFAVDLGGCFASGGASPAPPPRTLATTPFRVKQLVAAPDGRWLAFITESRSKRWESLAPYGIYLAALPHGETRLLSHTEAFYEKLAWAPDSRSVFLTYTNGSVEGPYQDAQPRVYSVPLESAQAPSGAPPSAHVRWAGHFGGAVTGFAVTGAGGLIAAGRLGTEVALYSQPNATGDLARLQGWPGTYEEISTAAHSPRLAFVYSTLDRPAEVYLADRPDALAQARPITSFNKLFTERALPEGKPYRWTADDGAPVEGLLIYPPGHFDDKHLPMFTLIHGGPEDADGNHFEADWYQWGELAATQGWLVFEPNYRGSVGYGDAFALGIIPHIVSRPGKDILEGVDALVKDGIADPARLTVGGYSYGGYMTNWLITQTTRFKAAVTGAGAVEHVANWGNDDTTLDDAYFLGGLPWQAEANYNAEAAIWQFAKVTTPTHVVGGSEDIRVYVGEDYLLERALTARGIPTSLLIFPGEGHSLDKNPWHGKIKVRDEIKWLKEYGTK